MSKKAATKNGESGALVSAAWKRSFARQLLAWYQRHKRDLPWRQSSDPYLVWVSEIMLQQTQVATVVPYFQRFVTTFPSIAALASAEEHEVLRHWEGLGYYRRARQLHAAARLLASNHGAMFPSDFATLRQLPGIGRYTAGAIMSIAFDQPAPILEANTVRLFSRLIGFGGDSASRAGQELLWQFAAAVLPAQNCRTFNQALMELGSLVCTPRAPQCQCCPSNKLCAAFRTGEQDKIPAPRAKAKIEAVREAAVVVWRKEKVLLRQRTAGERWAGLWDFLRFTLAHHRGAALREELVEKIRDQSGLDVDAPRRLATLKHGVTRFRITLDCYSARFEAPRVKLAQGNWKWLRPSELAQFPLSVTGRKLGDLVNDQPAD